MKQAAFYLIVLLSILSVASCSDVVKHDDPFYNVSEAFSMESSRVPLIKPIEIVNVNGWILKYPVQIKVVNGEGGKVYRIDVEKIDIQNGVIMAYSPKINEFAGENYYPWVVIVLEQETSKSFETEEEFLQYIQTLGISSLSWQTPTEALLLFRETGCFKWIPDCK